MAAAAQVRRDTLARKMAGVTTHLSSKGQVVIPAWARRKLGFPAGQRFRVEVGSLRERTILLRPSTTDRFEQQIAAGSAWLERRGMSMVEALHRERRAERERERRSRR